MIEHWILEAFREELFEGYPEGIDAFIDSQEWIRVDCEWCGGKCVSPPPDVYAQLVKNIHYMCNECKQLGRDLEALEEADDGEERALGA